MDEHGQSSPMVVEFQDTISKQKTYFAGIGLEDITFCAESFGNRYHSPRVIQPEEYLDVINYLFEGMIVSNPLP